MRPSLFIAIAAVALCGVGLFAYENMKQVDPGIKTLTRAAESAPTDAISPGPAGLAPPEASTTGTTHEGEVLETMDVRGYTYVRFKAKTGNEMWAALPKSELRIGETVSIIESMLMKDFTSPSLSRTFDTIIFGVLAGAPPVTATLPAGHPTIDAGPIGPTPDSRGDVPALPPGHPTMEAGPIGPTPDGQVDAPTPQPGPPPGPQPGND